MRKLTLITALLRPQNLLALQASIYNNLGTELPWQWIIAVDGKFVPSLKIIPPVNAHVFFCQNILKSYGFLEKNTALDLVEEDSWIYFMDDDTEVHPNFLNLFNRTLIENPNTRGMVFSQLLPDGTKRITPDKLPTYLGKIDMCQFVVKRSLIGSHRFLGSFGSDGEFFNRIYSEDPESFVFKEEIGFHHNNLRAGEHWTREQGYGRLY